MKNFTYIQPGSLKEANKNLGEDWRSSLLLAGGTDLLGLMKDGIEAPQRVVNLKSVPGLETITYEPGRGLTIGALASLRAIAGHPVIREKYTALAEAASEVASPQLRNIGTLAGNLCQRPRCWYYRGGFKCLRRGGDACFAVDGRNKFHCVIGGGPCFIVHPSDTAVALAALNASVTYFSGRKTRTVPVGQFFLLPEINVERENILSPGDILTQITIPDLPAGAKSGFIKMKERGAWDFALVSVAAMIQRTGQVISSGTVALGGIAPIPWLEKNVSSKLAGLSTDSESLAQASQLALTNAEPLAENGYKIPLARNLIKRTLGRLCEA
ncbi:MAG: FAD binding domain-containing protein [Candidatus Zhuqueibacterota bacterium]